MESTYALLKKYNIHPKKGLGQNFLADSNHLRKIVEAAELSGEEVVLEVGPGLGALTTPLTQAARHVVAVEVDPVMAGVLAAEVSAANFSLVQADILSVEPATLLADHVIGFTPGDDYVVVANLPYYITSAILRHLLELAHPPRRLVLTVQKEVALRVTAKPGDMSILAVSVQFYGQAKLCHIIPATAFVPSPQVDSAVLRVDCYAVPPVTVTDVGQYFKVVKAGFGQKRKQLKNSLMAGLNKPQEQVMAALQQAGINPQRRAETLSLEEWARLTQGLG